MRRPYRYALIALALLTLAAFTWQVGHTQTGSSEYFPQTRHRVEGAFLTYYRSTPDPELYYGYPITEAFTDRDGQYVQYFQRARFERLPDGSVALTPVGSELYEPGRPVEDSDMLSGACRNFGTDFPVCTDFLRFFETHGGVERFGRPISRVEQEGLRHVQYFEYTRLEWVPEAELPGLDVRIGALGWLYFQARGEDPTLLRPAQTANILEVSGLQVHAFTTSAAISAGGDQEVYVVVQDEAYAALPGAAVQLAVSIGGEQVQLTGQTNEHGFVAFPLAISSDGADTGIVNLTASADFAGLTAETLTSFRLER